MTQKLQDCLANCSLSCDETVYSGSISFAHLSSQATAELLNVKSDEFTSRFLSAVELSDRLSYTTMASAAAYWLDICAMADTYSSNVEHFYRTSSRQIERGLQLYSIAVFKRDLDYLYDIISQFKNFYNSKYKLVRNAATRFTARSVECVANIYLIMLEYPDNFDTYGDAYWYYTRLATLVDSCVSNTLLAITYLSQAANSEFDNQYQFAPQYFYANQSTATLCGDLYTTTMQVLITYNKQIQNVSSRITQWLSVTKNDAQFFSKSWNLHDYTESIELNSIFIVQDKQGFNISKSEQVSYCLLAYEQMLNSALAATRQGIANVPTLLRSDYSMNITSSWLSVNTFLKRTIHNMLTGYYSGPKSANLLTETLNGIVYGMQITDNENTMSMKAWMVDIAHWQSNITSIYASVIDSLIILCALPLRDTMSYRAAINNISIFLEPVITFGAKADIQFAYKQPMIYEETQLLLVNGKLLVVEDNVNSNVGNATAAIKLSVNKLRKEFNNLVQLQMTLNDFTASYLAHFNVDNTFVG